MMTDMVVSEVNISWRQKGSHWLWAFFVGFPIGVAMASWWRDGGIEWLLVAVGCGILGVWFREERSRYIALAFFGAAVGAVHTQAIFHERTDWQAGFREEMIRGEARIAGEWLDGSYSSSVPIVWENCFDSECPYLKSLLSVRLKESWLPGERIRLECALKLPENTSETFDYRTYLLKDGVGTICESQRTPEQIDGGTWETRLFRVRERLETSLSETVPEPESGFLAGLIFGGSDRLPRGLRDDFTRTGVSHIVAVSGYNVLIVAEGLLLIGLGVGLWRRQAVWFSVAGIWLFALVTGLGASVLRATTMATIVLVAMQSGRVVASWRLLVGMFVLLLFANPLLLRYDIGFQLSVVATAVLLFGFASFQERETSGWHSIRTLIQATLAIEVCIAPILLWQFGFVSAVSLLANALILPVIPFAMALAFGASLLGLFVSSAGNVFGWAAYFLAQYVLRIVSWLSYQSWSTLSFSLTVWQVIAWYVVAGGIWYSYERKKRLK